MLLRTLSLTCLTLTFLASLLAAGAARAQAGLPRFDCPALLQATGMAEPSAKKNQRLMAAPLRLSWSGDGKPDRKAPVVMVPLRSGITARIARSDPARISDGIMSCTLIGMSVRPFQEAETPYTLEDVRGGPRPAELPLLLIGRYDSIADADRAFSKWVERGFPIPVSFPEPTTFSRGGGRVHEILGDHRSFLPLPILGDIGTTEANVLALNPDRAPQDARIFLRTAGLDDARVILALCGTGDCADFRGAEPMAVTYTQAPAPATLGPDTSPDPALPGVTSPAPGSTAAVPQPSAPPVPEAAIAPPDASPRPEDRATGQPTPATGLRLTYLGIDGREDELPEALSRRLDCVLDALGADIFIETPTCPDRAFAALSERRALLRRVDDSHWQIVAGAQDRPPRAIIVTLPAGQSGAACRMDIVYDSPDGAPVILAMNPVPGVTPAQFTALPLTPLPVVNGRVRARLIVSSPADCGGPGRDIDLPTQPALSLSLGDDRINRAALHVVAMDAGDLEVALGQDPSARLLMGSQLIGAIEAAQARLAAGWGDTAWTLSSVNLSRLNETDGLSRILALPSDALRDSDMRFSTISPAARSGLAEMRPRVTPETLATALAPAVEDAAARGITHLSLSLIAPVTPRTAVALADPCTDQRFATLARDLARPGGPEISVTVFPLVRLRDGDSPALDALQPLSFDPDAPTRPGGLTRCRGGDDALTTYPFFIEPWRPDSDIAGRYAAALADRLALHLSTQLTEDKARP